MTPPLILKTENSPQVETLSLNRPGKRNALSLGLIQELYQELEEASKKEELRVLIIKGEGVAFCTGLDLQEVQDPDHAYKMAQDLSKVLLLLHSLPCVTIATVHGAAMAGGAGIMSACDFAIAAEETKIGYPETRRGLVAAMVMTLLRRQIPERYIRELLLLAEPIKAVRARAIGLINRVVPPEKLEDTAMLFAKKVCLGAPEATANTKKWLNEFYHCHLNEDLGRSLKYHLYARQSDEADEGIFAFVQKRAPSWVWIDEEEEE